MWNQHTFQPFYSLLLIVGLPWICQDILRIYTRNQTGMSVPFSRHSSSSDGVAPRLLNYKEKLPNHSPCGNSCTFTATTELYLREGGFQLSLRLTPWALTGQSAKRCNCVISAVFPDPFRNCVISSSLLLEHTGLVYCSSEFYMHGVTLHTIFCFWNYDAKITPLGLPWLNCG